MMSKKPPKRLMIAIDSDTCYEPILYISLDLLHFARISDYETRSNFFKMVDSQLYNALKTMTEEGVSDGKE